MTQTNNVGRPEHSLAFSRTRDSRVEWLLGMHPVTAAMLVGIGLFPSKDKALRRLNRLVEKGRIRLVGTVCRKGGRPEHVFCRWRSKADDLVHEVELTEVCLRLDASKILRGPHATDTNIRPDAEVWINGGLNYLELDRGTMSYAQIVTDRFHKYASCPYLSLWVCPNESRRDGLRLRAESVRHSALFASLPEVLVSPHGRIWVDFSGHWAALPRESGGTISEEK
jgi:hypothetical protein